MILSGEFQGNHLNELKVLALFFHFESDVFLQRVPNIEKLEVCDGSFKETFCFDSLNVDEDGLVSQLKVICSDSLTELVSIGSENSEIVCVFVFASLSVCVRVFVSLCVCVCVCLCV